MGLKRQIQLQEVIKNDKNAETTGACLVSLVHQLVEYLTYKQGIAGLNSASGIPLPP